MPVRSTLPVIRVSRGLSPGELARLAGVSYSLIYKAEQGEPISKASAEKICKALGVELSEVEGLNVRP